MKANFTFPAFLALLWVLLHGCKTTGVDMEPPVETAAAFSRSGDAELADRWWTAFDDSALHSHIQEGLAQNFSLASAWERHQAALALVKRESASKLPELEGTADANVERSDGDSDTLLGIGLRAEYQVDIWGRIDSIVRAERASASAEYEAYRLAALALSADIASTWFQLLEAEQQKALLLDQIETNRKVLKILETRFANGQIGSADVLRQRQLIEATHEQLIGIEARKGSLQHLLSVLKGHSPDRNVSAAPAFPELPPLPETGLTTDLLRRRPDVRNAMYTLQVEDARLAAAMADRYPRIDLIAALSSSAENPAGLFDTWLGSMVAQLVAPLFDGGRRKAEIERQSALVRQRVYDYGQVVLDAIREVEDALLLEQQQIYRIENLRRQSKLNRQTWQQLRIQYLNGATDYISVLSVLTEGQRLQREEISAIRTRLDARVELYRALASGFATPLESGIDTG